jgi:hypothetical protein
MDSTKATSSCISQPGAPALQINGTPLNMNNGVNGSGGHLVPPSAHGIPFKRQSPWREASHGRSGKKSPENQAGKRVPVEYIDGKLPASTLSYFRRMSHNKKTDKVNETFSGTTTNVPFRLGNRQMQQNSYAIVQMQSGVVNIKHSRNKSNDIQPSGKKRNGGRALEYNLSAIYNRESESIDFSRHS